MSKASRECDANIGKHLDAPHTHGYGIMAKRSHAKKHSAINCVGFSCALTFVLPGRSGPKRLGCERCGMALTMPSPHCGKAFTAVPHPRLGRCLSTLVFPVAAHTLAFLNTGSATWTATQFAPSHSRSSSVSSSKHQLFVVRMIGTRHKNTS